MQPVHTNDSIRLQIETMIERGTKVRRAELERGTALASLGLLAACGGGTTAAPTPPPPPPPTFTANNDAAAATEDNAAAVAGNLLTNDVKAAAADTLTVTEAGVNVAGLAAANVGQTLAGTFGDIVVNADGGFSYQIDNADAAVQALGVGETATDSFSYRIDDNNAATAGTKTATLTVTVTGVNDPVDAGADQTGSATEDGVAVTGTVAASDVDANDVLSFSINTAPAEGSASVNAASGLWSFDPGAGFQDLDAGESRDASFTIRASDGHGTTDDMTVTVTVNGAEDPVALGADASLVATAGTPLNLGLAAPTDLDGDGVITVTAIPDVGRIETATGTVLAVNAVVAAADVAGLRYVAATGETGNAGAFTLSISDGTSNDSQTIAITTTGASLSLAALNGSNGAALTAAGITSASVALAGGGDINGDGVDDVLIGLGGGSFAAVLFGNAAGFAADIDLAALAANAGLAYTGLGDGLGSAVAIGDVNGDNIADFILGAPLDDTNGADAGVAYLLLGGNAGLPALGALDGSNGLMFEGSAAGNQVGAGAAIVSSLNGDGFGDVLVGAPGVGAGADSDRGLVGGLFGDNLGAGSASFDSAALTTADFRILGSASETGGNVGAVLAGGGDIDGDGAGDFVVGVPDGNAAYVIFGAAGYPDIIAGVVLDDFNNIADGANGFRVTSGDAGDRVGSAAAQLGDVNGDGIADVVIGVAGHDGVVGANSGAIAIIFGQATAFPADIDLDNLAATPGVSVAVIEGGTAGGGFGSALGLVDFDGDGVLDIIVGAPDEGANGNSYILFGGADIANADPGTPDGTTVLAITGAGSAVAGAGDVNGDGFGDVLIGGVSNGVDPAAFLVLGFDVA